MSTPTTLMPPPSSRRLRGAAYRERGSEAEAAPRGLALVELDENGWLVAERPRVVAGEDHDGIPGAGVEGLALGGLDAHRAGDHHPDVDVRAARTPDGGRRVLRPAPAGGVRDAQDGQ